MFEISLEIIVFFLVLSSLIYLQKKSLNKFDIWFETASHPLMQRLDPLIVMILFKIYNTFLKSAR